MLVHHLAIVVCALAGCRSPQPAPPPLAGKAPSQDEVSSVPASRTLASLSESEAADYCAGLDRLRTRLLASDRTRAACLMEVIQPLLEADPGDIEVRKQCANDYAACLARQPDQPSTCAVVEAARGACDVTLETVTACTRETQLALVELVQQAPCERGVIGEPLYDKLRTPSCVALETACNQ